jgi:probable phosphoglycerate mutase
MAERTRLVLVRHAQSVSNAEGVIGGHHGCRGLSELGVHQAEALAQRLAGTQELAGVAAVYTSILPRAIETAEIVARSLGAVAVTRSCDYCEQHPGEADGMRWEDFEVKYGGYSGRRDPTRPLSPGGESWLELLDRSEAKLSALAEAHAGETVLLVTHGGVIDASLVRFLGVGESGVKVSFRTWNSSMTEWHHDGRRWALVHYNDTAHLSYLGVPPSR